MNTFASPFLTNALAPIPWAYVARRFRGLQRALELTHGERGDGATKVGGVVASLNRALRNESSTGHFRFGGSWGKKTAISPPADIDVLYFPPIDLFHQFNARSGNKQSQLLQHLREALSVTYPQTEIRGDGQVVVVSFDSVRIEVVPAFAAQSEGYIICDANGGGTWKRVIPEAEERELDRVDIICNSNARKLTRVIKQWKQHCNVPIKSFHIEQLVREVLCSSSYGFRDEFWFDWLVRDTFQHMYGRAGGGFFMPGNTNEWISLDSTWQNKAWSAYQRALAACEHEHNNMNLSAGLEWQKIFGPVIPEMVI